MSVYRTPCWIYWRKTLTFMWWPTPAHHDLWLTGINIHWWIDQVVETCPSNVVIWDPCSHFVYSSFHVSTLLCDWITRQVWFIHQTDQERRTPIIDFESKVVLAHHAPVQVYAISGRYLIGKKKKKKRKMPNDISSKQGPSRNYQFSIYTSTISIIYDCLSALQHIKV